MTPAGNSRPLLLRAGLVLTLLLLLVLTFATLFVAGTCTAPLHEGGRSSAPVLKQGVLSVSARLRAMIRRMTSRGAAAGVGAAAALGDVSLGALPPRIASVSDAHIAAARRILAALDAAASKGDERGEPHAGHALARSLAESVIAVSRSPETLAAAAAASHAAAVAARARAAAANTSGADAATKTASATETISSSHPVWSSEELYTQQTCHISSDESESCTYEGVLCYDGVGPVVVSEFPTALGSRVPDAATDCLDPRSLEASSEEWAPGGCVDLAANGVARPVITQVQDTQHDTLLSQARRRWGPLNRGVDMTFTELHPSQVWGDDPAAIRALLAGKAASLESFALEGEDRDPVLLMPTEEEEAVYTSAINGSRGGHPLERLRGLDVATRVLAAEPGPHPALSTLRVRLVTRVGNRSVSWVDDGLWLSQLDKFAAGDAFAWFQRIGSIYEAQRANATPGFGDHPRDGFIHAINSWTLGSAPSIFLEPPRAVRSSFRVGSQWRDVPPMSTLAFVGKGLSEVSAYRLLPSYFASSLALAIQPETQVFFNDLRKALDPASGGGGSTGGGSLVCSTRGAIVGNKAKFFSGRMDGLMWKQYAYRSAGLAAEGVLPHPRYPPRMLTIIESSNMGGNKHASGWVWNMDAVIAAVEATGIPYTRVPTLDGLSFSAITRIMAGSSVLVVPYGPAVATAMLLPAHATLVELFPFGMQATRHAQLSSMTDVHYFRVVATERVPIANMSTPDGLARFAARGADKVIDNAKLVWGEAFWRNCESQNVTGFEQRAIPECARALISHPIHVPHLPLRDALRDAIDCAGTFSMKNPAWASLAPDQGQPVRPPPNRTKDKDRFGING